MQPEPCVSLLNEEHCTVRFATAACLLQSIAYSRHACKIQTSSFQASQQLSYASISYYVPPISAWSIQ